jgi:hypothetical protein
MSTETNPTTRLQAVNMMLRAIGESPVSTLEDDGGLDLPNAEATLDEILIAVLTEGWQFNTEYNYPLVKDLNGNINVPPNTLSCDFQRTHTHDPVLRGTQVYDRKNHTYSFPENLKATIVFGLPFEQLPQSGRTYVAYRAARKFQDTELGSDALHQYNEADEYRARIVFTDEQADDEDLNLLRDTPGFHRLR